jgi:hypothetical protein
VLLSQEIDQVAADLKQESRSRREMLAQKRTLIIVGASKMVKCIFGLTSFSKVFDMRPTLDDAAGATDYHRVEVVADGD